MNESTVLLQRGGSFRYYNPNIPTDVRNEEVISTSAAATRWCERVHTCAHTHTHTKTTPLQLSVQNTPMLTLQSVCHVTSNYSSATDTTVQICCITHFHSGLIIILDLTRTFSGSAPQVWLMRASCELKYSRNS